MSQHPRIDPVVVGMQVGMQVVFAGLLAFAMVMAAIRPSGATVAILLVGCALALAYTAVLMAHAVDDAGVRRRVEIGGLAGVVVGSLALVWLTPYAAYLLVPLAFLFLERLPAGRGAAVVGGMTALAIVLGGTRGGWTVGGVVGPLAAAGAAVVIGLAFQAMRRQKVEQERLYADLVATQDRLAASERSAGTLAERARLAREIHDTVAQGLSSITLLLHAVERADPDGPAMAQVRLARDAAASSLAETRRFIRELAPPLLDQHSLGGALRRLAETTWKRPGLTVDVRVADSVDLPMDVQTALLRVAQGAMANVLAHAQASSATLELTSDGATVILAVRDDGVGMDADQVSDEVHADARDSFGLRAIRERAEQLGGHLVLTTAPGRGTEVAVHVPVSAP